MGCPPDISPAPGSAARGAAPEALLNALLKEVRACRVCDAVLPLGPRPILRASPTARILLVGQAPGTKVHETGIPWNDRSGDRLRDWLGLGRETFYDEGQVAIIPMGLCYPGTGRAGDLPPRPECAQIWHPRLLPLLPQVRLTLLIGAYAQAYFLGERRKKTLAATVAAYDEYGPKYAVLPHPSPRNQLWLKQNPWFAADVLPEIRARVHAALEGRPAVKGYSASPAPTA